MPACIVCAECSVTQRHAEHVSPAAPGMICGCLTPAHCLQEQLTDAELCFSSVLSEVLSCLEGFGCNLNSGLIHSPYI
jgi:hypothetical protein